MRLSLVCLCLGALSALTPASALAAPPNDAFADAETMTALPATIYSMNMDATLEVGEPVPHSSAGASVWYNWTAPFTGSVSVDTLGSSFDTILGVWSGNDVPSLVLVASNDNDPAGGGQQSALSFWAQLGTTYHIAVYGSGGQNGAFTLNVRNAGTPTGEIAGVVTEANGTTPIQGAYVFARRWTNFQWVFAGSAETGEAGTYTIGGLESGWYLATFMDLTGDHVTEFYDGQLDMEDATWIYVAESASVTGVNASMTPAGVIDGRVTAGDTGLPLEGVQVYARRWTGIDWEWSASDTTDVDGIYHLAGLRTASYRVEFPTVGPYLWECYSNAYESADATLVDVLSGETTKDIDAVLDLPGQVTGRVGGAGKPLVGAEVMLRRAGHGGYYGQAWTDADGFYVIDGVAPGNDYEVKADARGFAARWWENASHRDGATPVTVVSGVETHSISFDLPAGVAPAYVAIASEPAGADIYLDGMGLGAVTPLQLQLRPAASHPLILAASHGPYVVTVRSDKYPRPEPREVYPVEGETVQVLFPLAAAAGAVRIETYPADAEVFVDTIDAAAGRSPLTLGDLAAGEHVLYLRKDGYLQPRPVEFLVRAGETNDVALPLTALGAAPGMEIEIHSRPNGAAVHVDGLPAAGVSDLVVTGLDPTRYSGPDWWSASHVVWVVHSGLDFSPRQLAGDAPAQTLWFVDDGSLTPLEPMAVRTPCRRPFFAWSEAWGAHGYEISVVPTDVPRGVRAAIPPSYDSGLLPLGQLGWRPEQDLPPGQYTWYVRRWLGSEYDNWVEGSVFTITELLIDAQTLPDGRVGSPYHVAFAAPDGVAPVVWFTRQGPVRRYAMKWTDGNYVSETGNLTPLLSVSGNDTYTILDTASQTLPYALPFYGALYDSVGVDSNGRVDFQLGASDYEATLAKLLAQTSAAPYWTDLFSASGVLLSAAWNADRVAFEWEAEQRAGRSSTPVRFTAVHWFDGRIDFRYDGQGFGALVGLSAGNGVDCELPEQNFNGQCPMGTLSFTPLVLPTGMSLSADGVLEGTPEETGTFTLIIEARDGAGRSAERSFGWTVLPATQLQAPTLASTTPPQGALEVLAATNSPFQVELDNPDAIPVTYAWTWRGGGVGDSAPGCQLAPPWSESGTTGTLTCVVTAVEPPTELMATWQVAVDADNDNDTYRNIDEIRLGTNANDPLSFFVIESLSAPPEGTFTVTFLTAPGIPYELLRSPQLPAAPGDWLTVGVTILGAGGPTNVVVTPPAGAPCGYYRVRALLD